MLLNLCLTMLAIATAQGAESWVTALGGVAVTGPGGEVTGVSFRASWVTDGELARIAEFPKLQKLDLSRTHISDHALDVLRKLPSLTELDLTYAEHITDAGLARLRDLRSLQRLSLEGARITDSGMNSISSLVHLRLLNLRSTEITDSALEHLEPLVELEELAIGGNRIAGFGLTYLQALPKLKHLDLSGVQYTDDGIWSVGLTDLNIQTVAALEHLESLNIGGSDLLQPKSIPDGGLREFASIRITDLGIQKLDRMKNLRSLDLSRAQITAKGVRTLAGLPHLERLVLACAKGLDESALPLLQSMKQLRTIDLSEVKLATGDLKANVIRSGE